MRRVGWKATDPVAVDHWRSRLAVVILASMVVGGFTVVKSVVRGMELEASDFSRLGALGVGGLVVQWMLQCPGCGRRVGFRPKEVNRGSCRRCGTVFGA